VTLGVAAVAWAVVPDRDPSGPGTGTSGSPAQSTAGAVSGKPKRRPVRLVERRADLLPAAMQDAAAAPLGGGRVMLLGGLTAADSSSNGIVIASARGARRESAALPDAIHDAAAARLGSSVYLFGGGNGTRQLDSIVRVDPGSGANRIVARLPLPSSDQAAAVLDGTAYVVGGYTGLRWLDTVVAWRPGSPARVVGHLPSPVRYAAVTAAGGRIVVAGGSLPNGTASASVLAFDPANGRVVRLGRLPAGTTHAAAAALGPVAYVIGGRGTTVGTPTARITAIDPASRRIRPAGRLATPSSDLSAAAIGTRILIAGGRGPDGTEARIGRLVLAPARAGGSQTLARGASPAKVDVYADDGANKLTGAARLARSLVYVPNSQSGTVDAIDPRTYRIVEHFGVGTLPQHVVPAWNLRTLYVTNDLGNSLTPINPRTGRPGRAIHVDDPYNMYFTPDGRYAIVVAERLGRLDFRSPRSFRLQRSLNVPCQGVDHMDFSADGTYLIASCEFSGQLVKVDVASERVVGVLGLPDGRSGMPQDVKLSPDGRVFYVADQHADGAWEIDGERMKVIGFLRTGRGVHGLYPSRNGKYLYATNRSEGSVSIISFRKRRVVGKWWIPGGGSPDMGGVSPNGKVLWLSGRYNGVVYALSTRTGRLLARIPVGQGPHGLCVWPQPGRYSLGHTGNLR
jgi:DNA-binding beta-propeller fold protein YncE